MRIPIHARSKIQRLGKIGSCFGKSERCHSQPKKPIHEMPARTRSAIEVLADQVNARLTSFKTEIIRNDPVRSRNDPIRSRLANDRYEARVLSDGVCWSRPKLVGIATASIIIAMAHNGALEVLCNQSVIFECDSYIIPYLMKKTHLQASPCAREPPMIGPIKDARARQNDMSPL